MEWFLAFIKNICVFTLVITLILNLFPDSNYRKYIKLFAGFLLLIFVLQPFLKIKDMDFDIEDYIGDISYHGVEEPYEKESELESLIYERMREKNEDS